LNNAHILRQILGKRQNEPDGPSLAGQSGGSIE
jgi:hypothetical protein